MKGKLLLLLLMVSVAVYAQQPVTSTQKPVLEAADKKTGIDPFPVYDILNIKGIENIQYVKIFSNKGETVFEQKSSSSRIDVSSLPVGIYTIQVAAKDKIHYLKFIKDRKKEH